MPRDKTESHIRVVEAAKREFLEYGFADASMRRIAKAAGLTASALYKHFSGKEEMFASLVEPVVSEFLEQYRTREANDFAAIECPDPKKLLVDSTETQEIMAFIYDHLDAFRLLVSRSQGTKYERFVHEVAEMEERTTLRYMRKLIEKGISVREVDRKEFHLLVTTNIEAIFQAVTHNFTRKEALHYAKTLDGFYLRGWKFLFGL